MNGNGAVAEIDLAHTETVDGGLVETGETRRRSADQVFVAIGQTLEGAPERLALEGGKMIAADDMCRTSVNGVWAGAIARRGRRLHCDRRGRGPGRRRRHSHRAEPVRPVMSIWTKMKGKVEGPGWRI